MEAHLPWKFCFTCFSCMSQTFLILWQFTVANVMPSKVWIHELHGMFYMWCQMLQELQEICAINAPSGKSNKTAVLVIISMQSLVLHRTAEPQEALWHYPACITGHMTREVCPIPSPPPTIQTHTRDKVNKRVVRILLECILVFNFLDLCYLKSYEQIFGIC